MQVLFVSELAVEFEAFLQPALRFISWLPMCQESLFAVLNLAWQTVVPKAESTSLQSAALPLRRERAGSHLSASNPAPYSFLQSSADARLCRLVTTELPLARVSLAIVAQAAAVCSVLVRLDASTAL